jgi:hypothetical protein
VMAQGTTRDGGISEDSGYVPRVPGKRSKPSDGGRYDEREIAARVEKLRKGRKVEVKTICAAVGLEKWDWSRRVRLDRSSFTIPELSAIADYLHAPIGWPFIAEETGYLIERILGEGPGRPR